MKVWISNESFIFTNGIQSLISSYLECSTYLQNGVLDAEQAFLPGLTVTGTCNEGYFPLLGSLNATCDSDYKTIMSDRCVQSMYYLSRWLSGQWAVNGYSPYMHTSANYLYMYNDMPSWFTKRY